MSINYQFAPVVFSLKKRMRKELKGNQYKIMDTIADEIFLFQDTRLTLTKELSTRYLAGKTGICQPNIVRAVNKLEKKNFIRSIKSHVKGEGSLITIILDSTSISNNEASDMNLTSNQEKLDSNLLSNQENLFQEEDHQEEDLDSSLNSPEEEKQSEEITIKSSLNSESIIENNQVSSKVNNMNNTAVNLLAGGQASIGKNDFTSLGSVLNNSAPAPQINPSYDKLSEKNIIEGKDLLLKKGFNQEEVTTIINRITLAMKEKNIKSREKYFLASCDKEVRKNNNSIHKVTCSALPAKNNNFNNTVKKWEEEKKHDIKPEETIKQLMTLRPDDLYRVILDVDKSPAGKFISLPEIKASLYIAEFKKRFPEVII